MRARAGTRARREEPVALTARQEEVLRLLERGLTNTEIAATLGISLDGAKFHVSEIIGKLGVATREEAVEAWRQRRSRRVRSVAALPVLRWGAVAIAAGGVAAVAIVVALSSGDDTPGVAADTPEAQATATAVPESTPADPALAACPEPLPITPGGGGGAITWARMVRFDGIIYVGGGAPEIPDAQMGPPFGRIQFQFGDVVGDPSYSPRDCDAAWLPPGTMFYTIKGYSPRFRIATEDGRVYEAQWAQGISTAGEITDLRGKVVSIEFWAYNVEQPRLLGSVEDAALIANLVEEYVSAPYGDAWLETELGPQTVVLTFVLQDGTVARRNYDAESGFVRPAFRLPESFNEAARAAIAAGVR